MTGKGKVKVYVTLSDDLNEYFEDRARAAGQTKTAVIGMALLEYLEMKKAVKVMGDFSKAYNESKTLEK